MRYNEDRTVVGVDIIRSGGPYLSKYLYAIAVVRNGSLKKVEEGGLGKLVRILWENRPSVLAVDNILELGGSRRNLIKILKLFPPDTDIVQVTLTSRGFTSVRELALKSGILSDKSKLEPVKTAITLAILAEKGEGTKLRLFENKVKIIVSKGRSGFAGGSRSDKYQRNMRAAVSRVVRKIKEELERRGFDYDLMIRRSKGGIERALFIVYAERKDLFGVVEKLKGYDVRVRIKPVISSKFLRVSENVERRKYLIVGYDPGIEAGLAAIDLDSNPVIITSGRELDRGEVLSILSRYGIVAVVATDKNPPPEMVRKLAASLNAQLYVPQHSLSTSEKELIVKEFTESRGLQIRNTHERDALAAALKALKSFEQKLNKLQEKVALMGIKVSNIQKYKVRIIKNEPLSSIIEDMITDSIREDEKRRDRSVVIRGLIKEALSKKLEAEDKERRIRNLSARINELTRENEVLKRKIKELERIIREYEYELNIMKVELSRDVVKDRKVSELTQRLRNALTYIEELRKENERLKEIEGKIKEMMMALMQGKLTLIPVVRVNDLLASKLCDEIRSAPSISKDMVLGLGLRPNTKLVYLDLPREISSNEQVKYVISNLRLSEPIAVLLPPHLRNLEEVFKEKYIPAISIGEYPLIVGCVALINREYIDKLIKVQEDVERCKAAEEMMRKAELTEERLLELIETYRIERSRSLETSSGDEVR